MITELNRDELVALGARVRADYLLEQAGYTLGLAALDGKGIAALLPTGYLDEVKELVDAVNAARQDKTLLAAESKEAAHAHHDTFKQAKVWRRKVARRALRARRMGKTVPDGLLKISHARTAPAVLSQLVDMAKLLEASLGAVDGNGAKGLLEEGKTLAQSLAAVDAQQEIKRFGELPEGVRRFYEQKGTLYVALKVIHDAGQELYADDLGSAARYNLSILHRKTGGRKPEPQPQQA